MADIPNSPGDELRFESGRFLASLHADDPALLRSAQDELGVTLTARDGWLRIAEGEGGDDPEALDSSRQLFLALEGARRRGLTISAGLFKMAVAKAVAGEDPAAILGDAASFSIEGSSGKPTVVPKTEGQISYLRALRDHDVSFGVGQAGTGKTYLAVAHGLELLRRGEVRRIVLSRPAVEAGEALGFLPGDLEEKISPYLRPLYDALYDMLHPEEVDRMIEKGQLEVAPLAYMRGRTLGGCFVILDEAQNTTREQMFMLLTRLGKGTRCVVTGDPSQVDLRHNIPSGLAHALGVLEGVEGLSVVRFGERDVVRHPVVARIVAAYREAAE